MPLNKQIMTILALVLSAVFGLNVGIIAPQTGQKS